MGLSDNRRAMREVAAARFGFRCHYCGVPTGATIDHVVARASDEASRTTVNQLENLRLACPYCNFSKGDRPVEEWLAAGGARLEPPPLPRDVLSLLGTIFQVERDADGAFLSGSPNARVFADGDVALEVRSSRRSPWHSFPLGAGDHPAVVRATWDFLRRHMTPERKVTAR